MAAALSSESFKPLLKKLVSSPSDFVPEDVALAVKHMLGSAATPAQIAAFLTALHISGVERLPGTLFAAAGVLLECAVVAQIENQADVADIVGTGGDGHNTFNASTAAAIVAAGAGVRICKQGNYAATSSSGSADLLVSLGCALAPTVAPESLGPQILRDIPFQFLLASRFHPVLAAVGPVRKSLPFRTLFNLLGPLVNPARPAFMVLGVATPALGAPFATALASSSSVKRAMVVCGAEGLDELSIAGDSHVWDVVNGQVSERTVHPRDFGLPTHSLALVEGASPAENATTLRALLNPGVDTDPRPDPDPVLDFVLLNASAALVVAGRAKDFREGVTLARESVRNGKAWAALGQFRQHSP